MRKDERKDLTKASKIVSMPEIRKFKLDSSEKLQQEIDVDLDVALNDIGNEVSMAENGAQKMITQTIDVVKNFEENKRKIFSEAMQKTKQKSKEYKKTRREESTQNSLKERMPRKNIYNQLGSRTTNGLEKKQWKQSIGSNEDAGTKILLPNLHVPNANVNIPEQRIVNPSDEKNHNKRNTDPTQTEVID